MRRATTWFLLLGVGGTITSSALAQDGGKSPPPAQAAPAPAAPAKAAPAKAAPPAAAAPAVRAAPPAGPKALAPDKAASAADAKATEAANGSDGCPPGAYCEPVETEPPPAKTTEATAPVIAAEPPAAGGTTVTIPPPAPGSDPTKPRIVVIRRGQNGEPDQVIVYENGEAPPPVGQLPPAPPEPPPVTDTWRHHPRQRSAHRRWGFGLRAEGAILSQQHPGIDNFGMGGLGMSLKYRPVPGFALDFGADFIGGTDPNGLSRQEVPVSANLMLYLNPRSVAQFYLLGGANVAFAKVHSDVPQPNLAGGNSDKYTYAGGQAGAGFEFRLSPLLGVHIDGIGFVRTRIDSDGNHAFPEYYEPTTGEISNSSAGGLVRAGVNFWW